jgi:hypothetical protein
VTGVPVEPPTPRGAHADGGVPRFDPGTSVLVLAPTADDAPAFVAGVPPDPSLLVVGVGHDPAPTLAACRAATTVDRAAAVRVGSEAPGSGPDDAETRRVGDVADLTAVGVTTAGVVDGWPDERTVVWVDSLGPLVEAAGIDRAYRFVDVLAGRLGHDGATAFLRLDPADHDDRTVSRLLGAVDAVARAEPDGWTVRRR